MKLSKFYRQAVASLESQEREELRAAFEHGDFSDAALAIEAHVSESAEHAAAVVESLYEAMEAHSDVSELRELTVESLDLREAVVAVNHARGFTMESLDWANQAAAATFDRVGGIQPFRTPSQESLGPDDYFQASLEDFDEVVRTVEEARGDVAAKSLDGINRVFDALEDALPEIRDRMQALKTALGTVEYDEEKQIRLDDYITKTLAVNGQVPSSLKDYLLGYGRFADALLGGYSENALEAASKACSLGDALSGLKDDACPIEALACALKDIGDPRETIAPDQLGFVLPGSGPLFGASMDLDAPENVPEGPAGDLQVRMSRFCLDHKPLDPMSYDDRPEAADAGMEAPTIRVLSKDTICCGLDVLIKLIDGVNIKMYAEARRDAWTKARSAFERYRQSLQSVTPTQANDLRPLLPTVGEYCDTLFTLSVWPALYFLTNLVFTSNAFVLLAERSISGQTEEVEVSANADGSEVDVTDAVVDDEGEDAPAGDAVDDVDAPEGDDVAGGALTDVSGPAEVAPDAKATDGVGAAAIADEGGNAGAQATDVPPTDDNGADNTPPEEEAPAEAPEGEEPAPEVPEGGEVIPPAGEETPTGTEGPAEVIPPAEGEEPAASDEEEEEEDEDVDVIPRAEEEDEEEEPTL